MLLKEGEISVRKMEEDDKGEREEGREMEGVGKEREGSV